MEDLNSSVSTQSLICQEDHAVDDGVVADDDEVIDSKLEMSIISNGSVGSEPEESYIDILVSKESTFASEDSSLSGDAWLKCARADAIQWIMRTKDYFGFSFETAYLSITYFDRFLTRRSIDKEKSWVVRLLSVTCLSLAAKMEECIAPALPEYDTDECRFESDAMRRMELLILSTLDWRMSSVTPFAYLNSFASELHVPNEVDKLVSRSVGYIFAIIEDINLVDYPASTIAAAAILAASDGRLTNNLLRSKLNILSSCGAIENESVMYCYDLMTQESHEEPVPPDSCICSESSMNYAAGNRSSKRRRLQL
ncbi:cyclin-D5-2-like [Iris pallida]|uniref:Cyclin-D5-2-like n=1 Tax=Iris pallida TaxID=29817 RepID=A0AAX6EZB6_IRIPA|nr:cyclin-D5-2-like [Iris pallida]